MTLHDLQKLVTVFRTQSNATVDFCPTKLDIIVAVAITPGLTVGEYSAMLRIPESSMARHMRELREGKTGHRRPVVGLGLIEAQPKPDDWRRHEISLSRKGKLLIEQLTALGGS